MTTPRRLAAAAALAVAFAGLAGCSAENSDPFQLKVGDCLPSADTSGLVEKVETVDCQDPHRAEVYAALEVPESDKYPGTAELVRQAGGCANKFKDFVGKEYNSSDLSVTYFHPTEESWKQGDRQILCIVSVPKDTTTKGTLKGSSR